LVGVINAGSSSVKFSFYEGERRILAGQVDGIGARVSASASGPDGEKLQPPDLAAKPPTVPSEVLPTILPWAKDRLGNRRLAAVGHRVVHGGLRYSRPAWACSWLGVELDEAANREHKQRISTPNSRVGAYVIKTDENLMIARHARALVGS
jgi:acetate kinase